jgi:hypothetical protein
MDEVRCEQCGGTWLGPLSLDPEVSREVAALIRGRDIITGIRRLRETTGLGLRDAKGVELHITRESGKCQWCGADLPAGAVVVCGRCHAHNYDW